MALFAAYNQRIDQLRQLLFLRSDLTVLNLKVVGCSVSARSAIIVPRQESINPVDLVVSDPFQNPCERPCCTGQHMAETCPFPLRSEDALILRPTKPGHTVEHL
jgi:hypothetical protein